MTERYTKAMLQNIDERFPHNISSIDFFLIFNLDNIPTNTTSNEFNVYDHSEYFAKQEEIKDTFIEQRVLNLIYGQREK